MVGFLVYSGKLVLVMGVGDGIGEMFVKGFVCVGMWVCV